MSSIPAWAHTDCDRCHQPVAYVRTPRVSKGQPVDIPVDLTPTSVGLVAVAVTTTGGNEVLTGGPVTAGQARGMRAAGVPLYSEHKCNAKRGKS